MHTYAAYRMNIFKLEDKLRSDAFLIGNIAPDWINFVPDGRQLYRRKSHFRDQETAKFILNDFIERYYSDESDPMSRKFYEGYGFHIILDDIWGQEVYFKYFGKKVVPRSYYEECTKWDHIIKDWNGGSDCVQFLRTAYSFTEKSGINQDIAPNEIIHKAFLAARDFDYGDSPDMPSIILEEDIMGVIFKSIETFRRVFG